MPTKGALEVSEAERNAQFQKGWDQGNLVGLLLAFNDIITNKEANDTAAEFIRNKIRAIVKDPQTAEDLCPFDHPVGTKRPCLDTGYYETYNRDNVKLVNLRRTPITEITATGIKTTDAAYEFDAIVFATGFDAMTGALVAVDIEGRDGITLKEKWDRRHAHLPGHHAWPGSRTSTRSPGPQSPSVFSNMMISIEQHVDWIGDLLTHLRDNGNAVVEATQEAEDFWCRAQRRGRQRHPLPAGQLVVHGLERARQAAHADAVHRRRGRVPRRVRRDRGRQLSRLRHARRPRGRPHRLIFQSPKRPDQAPCIVESFARSDLSNNRRQVNGTAQLSCAPGGGSGRRFLG